MSPRKLLTDAPRTHNPPPDGVLDINLGSCFGESWPQPVLLAWRCRTRGSTPERLLRNGMVLRLDVPIQKPGPYQLRTAVRDKQSGPGGLSNPISGCDGPCRRWSLALRDFDTWNESQNSVAAGPLNGQDSAETTTSDAEIQAGPAVRRLRRGMWLSCILQAYNAQLDATGRPQLESQERLFKDGRFSKGTCCPRFRLITLT